VRETRRTDRDGRVVDDFLRGDIILRVCASSAVVDDRKRRWVARGRTMVLSETQRWPLAWRFFGSCRRACR